MIPLSYWVQYKRYFIKSFEHYYFTVRHHLTALNILEYVRYILTYENATDRNLIPIALGVIDDNFYQFELLRKIEVWRNIDSINKLQLKISFIRNVKIQFTNMWIFYLTNKNFKDKKFTNNLEKTNTEQDNVTQHKYLYLYIINYFSIPCCKKKLLFLTMKQS